MNPWMDKQWFLDSTWRAFRTFCQTLAALLGGQAFSIISADWASTLSVSTGAALISLLQSVDRGRATASVAKAEAAVEVQQTPVLGCGDSLR